ncbi:hypothetical protein Ndes2526B_g04144 [Nannochloris sp. 'desiccata']
MSLNTAFTGRAGVSRVFTPFNNFSSRPVRLPKPLKLPVKANPDNGVDDLDRQLKEDMERYKQRQSTVQTTPGRFQPVSIPTARTAADNADAPNFALKEAIDKFLIADFFFVVFALVSLGVSLAVNLAFESSALLDFWLVCWQWVFQPAIGLLMLGSIGSGVAAWAKDNLGKNK